MDHAKHMKRKVRLTPVSTLHYVKLVYRSLLFIGFFVLYLLYRIRGGEDVVKAMERRPIMLVLIWVVYTVEGIEKSLGIKAYDIYGLTETSGPGVAFECEEQRGMHINEDHFYAEIIDPETGETLPEGSKGELVFTALDKEAFPLLRYRTRDICVLTREKCSCGRNFVRMSKPMGRSDDMMIISSQER